MIATNLQITHGPTTSFIEIAHVQSLVDAVEKNLHGHLWQVRRVGALFRGIEKHLSDIMSKASI